MDFSKIKNSKAFNIALIIAVPAVIVAGYYGYQYYKKKKDENDSKMKLNPDGSINTDGMEYYKISTKFNPETAGKIYEAIVNIGYVPVGDIVIEDKGVQVLVIEIMSKPTEAEKIKKILPIISNDIKFEKITKEQSLILPKASSSPNKDIKEEKKGKSFDVNVADILNRDKIEQ